MRAALVGITVAALVLLRLVAGGFSFDQVWAEDGPIFLRDAVEHGAYSLGYLYGGYLHTVPRLLALVGSLLPLHLFDLYTVITGACAVGVLAAFVYTALSHAIGSRTWAAVAAFGMALVPAASVGSLGNLAYLQWWLLPAAFAALLLGSGISRRISLTASTVILLAALSSPLALLMAPAAVVSGVFRTSRMGALVIGLAVQAGAMLFAPQSGAFLRRRDLDLTAPFIAPDVSDLIGPVKAPTVVTVIVGLVVMAATVMLWTKSSSGRRIALAATGSGGALFFVTTAMSNRTAPYYLAAVALLLLIGVAALGSSVPRATPLAAALGVAIALASFPASSYRTSGPNWSEQAIRAQAICEQYSEATPELAVGPDGWPYATFTLSC